jgi:hypothetical protein
MWFSSRIEKALRDTSLYVVEMLGTEFHSMSQAAT